VTAALPVTDATFDEVVLASPVPVVVDFWAQWCAPCRVIGPVLDELAVVYDGRARFVAVDADDNPGLVARFGIVALPTLHLYTGGELVEAIYGARPKSELGAHVEALLAAAGGPSA